MLKDLGVEARADQAAGKYPVDALDCILNAEAAAAFDDLTRKGVTEGLNALAGTFRAGQFIPAVEYLRAKRVRTLLMQEMEARDEKVDLYVGGNDLALTNLTGHPTVVIPNGFTNFFQSPAAFNGKLYGRVCVLVRFGNPCQDLRLDHTVCR